MKCLLQGVRGGRRAEKTGEDPVAGRVPGALGRGEESGAAGRAWGTDQPEVTTASMTRSFSKNTEKPL